LVFCQIGASVGIHKEAKRYTQKKEKYGVVLKNARGTGCALPAKGGILPKKSNPVTYVIHAYDYPDSLAHRMAVRPAHLDFVRQLKARGQFILGGALLNDAGQMIGSMLMLSLDTDEQLQQYLLTDPYIMENVWEKIDVKPFREADVR